MSTELPGLPVEENPVPEPTQSPIPSKHHLRKAPSKWLVWVPLAFVLGVAAGYLIFALPLQTKLSAAQKELASAQSPSGNTDSAVTVPKNVKRYAIPTDGFPSYGPQNAKVTIVEFSDYECPFCKQWHNEVWPQIEKKYGSQVRLVYRDFPLFGLHNNAEPAAEAAHCADDQGKYWQYHDLLFNGQYSLGRSGYDAIASSLGMDVKKFDACLDASTYKDVVQSNYNFASKLGVSSTPTFFINGLALVGAQPFSVFDQVIQMEIDGKIPTN